MQTALEASLKIDMRRERARQYAAMLIHELAQGGYIADACRQDAECHLAAMFERNDVEITTEGQRRVEAVKAENHSR